MFTEVDALGDSDRGAGGFGSSGVIAQSYEKANERNGSALERLAKEETHLKSIGLTFDLPKEDA